MASEDHLVFDGYSDIYDRYRSSTALGRPWFREGKFAQAADANDAFSYQDAARTRVGNLIAHDGDRIEGADIVVDVNAQTLTLAAGRIYVRGDVHPVAAAVLTEVPMTGEVVVGVRVASTIVTHEDEPDLLGLHEGTDAHGEDGAIREELALTWGFIGDGNDGDGPVYLVYQLSDGTVIDQTPPPSLSGVQEVVAAYDRDAHGSYIVDGCGVSALGKEGDAQVFSIAEGTANIWGFKKTRLTALRYSVTEDPDFETVDGEVHTFADGGSGTATITLNRPPLNGLTYALVTKQITETIIRGAVANTADTLSNSGVTEIVSVVQGATTYTATTDYTRVGDTVSWAPGGSEPAGGSSYDVTYRYLDAVTPDSMTARTLVLTGGVTGTQVVIGYTYKLRRMDRICLDRDGRVVYLKGVSAIEQPRAPKTPATLLSLAVIANDWFGTPNVQNSGIRSLPYSELVRHVERLYQLVDGVAEDRLRNNIHAREPVAKQGIFVDPLTSDRYRDAGESQDGAVFQGSLQVAIDPTFSQVNLPGPQHLDFTEVFTVQQPFITGCMKINPYQNFTPPPIRVAISPAIDRWTESAEQWLSPQTQVFGSDNTQRTVTSDIRTVSTSTQQVKFLRQITVNFTLNDFGAGEALSLVTFDGINVTPAGPLVANGSGVVTGSFVIPANVAAGQKLVLFQGASGRRGSTVFDGQGTLETTTRQEVTTVWEARVPDPVAPEPPPVAPEPPPVVEPTPQPPVVEPVVRTVVRIVRIRRVRTMPPAQEETVVVNDEPLPGGGEGGPDGEYSDPLAQSFSLPFSQHVTGVDVRFCAVGDRTKPVICEIVEMNNGWPTPRVIAQTEIDMTSVPLNTWQTFSFDAPIFLSGGTQYAFVFLTDDPDHSLSIARRGGFDAIQQQFVAAQPYTVGVLFSSSNRITWTAHQDEDLSFRIRCARFAPTTKTIPLGTFPVTDLSDILVDTVHMLPDAASRAWIEFQPAGEPAVRVEIGQVWERQSYFTGNVAIRLVLQGSVNVSPLVARDLLVIKGEMRASGTYVSRAFTIGTDVNLSVVAQTRLPSGSAMTVEWDAGDDNWTTISQASALVLSDGSVERAFTSGEISEAQGRIRITLTGTPAARPAVWSLRAWTRPAP